MNKTEILAALTAAGIACDPSMTVAALKELAAANNVSLVKTGTTGEQPAEEQPAEEQPAEEQPAEEQPLADLEALIGAKVAAGLTREQAIEVIERQAAADAAAK